MNVVGKFRISSLGEYVRKIRLRKSTRLFYKKLGSDRSNKSLNLTRNFVHFSTKSFLIGFLLFECMNCQCGR